MRSATFIFLAAALLLIAPSLCAACPVCGASTQLDVGRTRTAFLLTTAFMLVVPGGMLVALITWICGRSRSTSDRRRL
jgi:hypothetical protein